ncbi:MAG TPA: YoaK family protein, partial [Acidobacteriaceae bacterium]|nr:YoaK family protein [Acidobacteriaceae bacterium]
MSGNTVSVAIQLSRRDWGQAWAHACPLIAFFPGLIAGDAIVKFCKLLKLRSALAPALVVEALGLGLFILLGHSSISSGGTVHATNTWAYALLVGLLAFSMGLQNGALRRIAAMKDVHTYVTGTLLASAHGLTDYFFWLGRRLRFRFRSTLDRIISRSRRNRSLRMALVAGGLWVTYITGAIIGALLRSSWGIDLLFLPIGILLVIAVADVVKPIPQGNDSSPD